MVQKDNLLHIEFHSKIDVLVIIYQQFCEITLRNRLSS